MNSLWIWAPSFGRFSQKAKTEEPGSWGPPADGKVKCHVDCQENLHDFPWKPVCQREEPFWNVDSFYFKENLAPLENLNQFSKAWEKVSWGLQHSSSSRSELHRVTEFCGVHGRGGWSLAVLLQPSESSYNNYFIGNECQQNVVTSPCLQRKQRYLQSLYALKSHYWGIYCQAGEEESSLQGTFSKCDPQVISDDFCIHFCSMYQ